MKLLVKPATTILLLYLIDILASCTTFNNYRLTNDGYSSDAKYIYFVKDFDLIDAEVVATNKMAGNFYVGLRLQNKMLDTLYLDPKGAQMWDFGGHYHPKITSRGGKFLEDQRIILIPGKEVRVIYFHRVAGFNDNTWVDTVYLWPGKIAASSGQEIILDTLQFVLH